MPELPEVEITRRHLDHALRGRRMVRVMTTHARTARHNAGGPTEVDERLEGRTVLEVGRKGKFLAAPLDDGQTLIAHLGMSGRFMVGDPSDEEPAHTHFRATLDDGVEVRFIDPRTFGFVAVVSPDEISASGLSRVGPDAWDTAPGAEDLAMALAGRTAPVKALLLDQVIVSGLGNIYADEVLHLAGIHPLRPGGDLTVADLERLLAAIEVVLTDAIENGGTSLDDLAYLLPDGTAGENLDRLRVYGRTGLPCPECGTPVEKVVIEGKVEPLLPDLPDAMTEKAIHAHVAGRVQQVGFRQACRQVARSLGLVGWARNQPDGRVEVFAQGESDGVDRLVEWLWSGPAMAMVTGVESDVVAPDRSLRDFFIQPNPTKSG